jgi:hypothetical protein
MEHCKPLPPRSCDSDFDACSRACGVGAELRYVICSQEPPGERIEGGFAETGCRQGHGAYDGGIKGRRAEACRQDCCG